MRQIIALVATLVVAFICHAQPADHGMPMEGMEHMNMDHAAHMATMAKAQHQALVSARGDDVMPFSLTATVHIFTKDAEGGVQQVAARNRADGRQTELIRHHLQDIQAQFLKGDFSGPSHIHGAQMPGLTELKAAKPGQLAIEYKDIKGGAQLAYRTADPLLVAAVHEWFDAQVSDHGKDAMEGHEQ